MKAKELIKELQSLVDEHGDITVRLQCDHGQELMRSTWCGVSFVDNDDTYMPEFSDSEHELDTAVKVIEIQAF